MSPIRPLRRAVPTLAAAILALTAAACTDRANPLAPAPAPDRPGTPARPIILQSFTCTGDRAALTLRCVAATPPGPRSDLILGGQGIYVTLTSSNLTYNAGTGEYSFDVTVQNLIQQPLGTTDGTTLDPTGVRPFFNSGPSVISGTGSISVLPDGFATFTAAGQPYYQYDQILAHNVTSSAKRWTLIIPPTVGTFTFTLFVSAPVQYPGGYISLDGNLPGATFGILQPGSTHQLAAVVKTAAGDSVPGSTVTYGTTDAGCATVSGTGLVTGVRYGTCSITATSGSRSGSLVFLVAGTSRTWTGSVSTDWNAGGNWSGGVVPASADTAVIPAGVPHFPVLTSNVAIAGVTVADLATLDVASFVLTCTGDAATGATAGSGIVASGAGSVVLSGVVKTMHGRFPATQVSGTYTIDGHYWGQIPQAIAAGRITISGFEMTIAQ